MDRFIESDERDASITDRIPQDAARGREREHSNIREPEKDNSRFTRPGREYAITDAQRETLAEIGRFRTLSLNDLCRYRYGNDSVRMNHDIRRLSSQRLLRTQTVWLGKSKQYLPVVALTKEGKKLLEKSGATGTFYSGIVKTREMLHDTAIYRMYQAEAARIEKSGGRIREISLDYELKRKVYSALSKEKPGTGAYHKRQAVIAAEHGLKVVRGHIQLPDLRIAYQTRDGEVKNNDLELATTHYRGGQLAAKAEAGFTFYASPSDTSRLSAVFDDHNIMGEILWL